MVYFVGVGSHHCTNNILPSSAIKCNIVWWLCHSHCFLNHISSIYIVQAFNVLFTQSVYQHHICNCSPWCIVSFSRLDELKLTQLSLYYITVYSSLLYCMHAPSNRNTTVLWQYCMLVFGLQISLCIVELRTYRTNYIILILVLLQSDVEWMERDIVRGSNPLQDWQQYRTDMIEERLS